MLCKTTNTTFDRIIKFIKPVSQEVTINFDYDNVYVETIDQGNVMFIKMKYRHDIECDEQSTAIIQHEQIEKFIKGKKEAPVSIEIDGKVLVKLGRKKLSLPKLVDTSRPRSVPNIPYDAVVSIGASEFVEAIKDVGLVGQVICFELKDRNLILSAKSDNEESYEFEFSIVNIKSYDDCKSYFSYDYLKDIASAVSGCDTLIISMGDNKPINIGIDDDDVELEYILANRMVND